MNVGVTRTGTTIVQDSMESDEEFMFKSRELSLADLFDYFCAYQWLSIRTKRKYGQDSDEFKWWDNRTSQIEEVLGRSAILQIKSELKLITSHELVKFGRQMVFDFLREY